MAVGHQRHVGGSLVDLMGRAEGVAFVQTVEATQGPPKAHTSMLLHQSLAGVAPPPRFLLQSVASPARYDANQNAIILFQRQGERWQGVQLFGEELLFEPSRLDEPTQQWLADLWNATHAPKPGAPDLGAVLRRGLRLPHAQLRKLAALDIEELSHHKPGLTAATQKALRADLEQTDLDPEVRFALSRALRIQ